ncbi:MAG TPA: nickel-type superoxide dismutase maturation protease [Anaerolineae bacterium]|nr:nickel-type superoxide dismutase maturation protease [Anaerolineae bacterium]
MEPLPLSSPKQLLLWLFRARRRIRVTGFSMYPTLKNNDLILVNPHAYKTKSPQINDIVLAQDPRPHRHQALIIKRITAIIDDRYHLRGDTPDPTASTDSRHYGPIPRNLILGQAICRLPRWPTRLNRKLIYRFLVWKNKPE